LWAVGNTLTIFAVRDIGLSLAFPLWNSNSLIGILWGTLLFRELRGSGWLRKVGVVGGAAVIFTGAILISAASATGAAHGSAVHGIAAALGAGLMFGSMYIPYRKAYITGLNPLTFLTFFTFGELTMMTAVAVCSWAAQTSSCTNYGRGVPCFSGPRSAGLCGSWATCFRIMRRNM
jgi:drug/metabolite transporter (DMT)-like permease